MDFLPILVSSCLLWFYPLKEKFESFCSHFEGSIHNFFIKGGEAISSLLDSEINTVDSLLVPPGLWTYSLINRVYVVLFYIIYYMMRQGLNQIVGLKSLFKMGLKRSAHLVNAFPNYPRLPLPAISGLPN